MNGAELRHELDRSFSGSYSLDVGAGGLVLLTVIDAAFEGCNRAQRLARVEPMIRKARLEPGIIDLYTPDEASGMGITLRPEAQIGEPERPASWSGAVSMIDSGEPPSTAGAPSQRSRRAVFYSYKGGVGRTTALVHTAFHLARAGQRVAIVDLDLEAPGVHTLLPPPDGICEAGLVDYLWEREVRPIEQAEDLTPEVSLEGTDQGRRTGIVYSVEDPVSRQPIFVVPAGKVDRSYVQRLDILAARRLSTSSRKDAWSIFEQELWAQFEPDVLLIDARTGLNDWGGLSLLRLADEAVLFLYPSTQNLEGTRLVRDLLREIHGTRPRLVLSPLPEGEIGSSLVARIRPHLALERDESHIEILYHPSVAAADRYPVDSALALYAPLANMLLESTGEAKLERAIEDLDRWRVVASLSFPNRDARDIASASFDMIFQKTPDFEKLLDDARWVVRGRKGTGKSTLYHLFNEHKENAARLARGRLEGIDVLSGHGPADSFRPTTDNFGEFRKVLIDTGSDWLSLWRAYAVVRIYRSSRLLDPVLRAQPLRHLRDHLQEGFPREGEGKWKSTHSGSLMDMVRKQELNLLSRDAMTELNRHLGTQNRKVWLLYDDLDMDIKEDSPWQQDALGGLMRLIYDLHNLDLHQIRFKVFLREDIWSTLVFTNKSHFGEARTLLLQWGIEDFLRLAHRMATGGSQEFRTLSYRTLPLTEKDLDEASEETLRKALAPLWGLHQETGKKAYAARWVYSRMTDASQNTYPRSLTILLREARESELRREKRSVKVPRDRLLRPASLRDGLIKASRERCDAIKNEYPRLQAFFANMNELRSAFRDEELRQLWQRTAADTFDSFDAFVKRLETIGILAEKWSKKSKYQYGIANLYLDGFEVKRVRGQTK